LNIAAFKVIINVTFCRNLVNKLPLSVKRKKPMFSALLALALIFGICVLPLDTSTKAVSQAELNALKEQQEQLNREKSELQQKADALDGEVNAQTQKLNVLRARLEITNEELDNLSQQIAIYITSIAEKENELNLANQMEREQMEKFKKRVRAMEENGTISYLAVIFQANSFTDLLTRIDVVSEIAQYDNNLVENIREAKDAVRLAKADLEAEMAEQEQVFLAYQEKQADIIAQQTEVQEILVSCRLIRRSTMSSLSPYLCFSRRSKSKSAICRKSSRSRNG
jgi:peptidoglycan hydrolase CwlO-like protein